MLAYQRGVCAICKRPPKAEGNRLSVDHDHDSGLVRGLLCWRCNKLLGYIETVAKVLGGALRVATALCDYLAHPPAVHALGEARYGRIGRVTNKARKTKSATRRLPKKRTRRPNKK